uniref:Uncharacterized protein n=1 Tax=Kalanchoe fedtschenkoi TaxID=63787 RepID=A0A7N0UF04_KALFE
MYLNGIEFDFNFLFLISRATLPMMNCCMHQASPLKHSGSQISLQNDHSDFLFFSHLHLALKFDCYQECTENKKPIAE